MSIKNDDVFRFRFLVSGSLPDDLSHIHIAW